MKKLVLLSIGMMAFALQSANAQILYSTYDDFTNGWSGGVTTFDYDGAAVNGLGNPSNAGGAGTGGSLQLGPVAAGWGPITWGPGLTQDALTALDGPLAAAPYSAVANYGPGFTVAASGTLTMIYTMPDSTFGGSYFQPAIWFNYNGTWGGQWQSTVNDLGPSSAGEVMEAVIPYTINAVSSLSYFQLGIGQNTDFSGVNNWYVDQIAVVPGSVTWVPEPGVMALIGVGLTGLMLVRRRLN